MLKYAKRMVLMIAIAGVLCLHGESSQAAPLNAKALNGGGCTEVVVDCIIIYVPPSNPEKGVTAMSTSSIIAGSTTAQLLDRYGAEFVVAEDLLELRHSPPPKRRGPSVRGQNIGL